MSEHARVADAVVTGLSALPGAARPFAATRAMYRFLNHDDVPFHALLEPAQDAVRAELTLRPGPFVLIVHDWSMQGFGTHPSKSDRAARSHAADLGYELGSALVVDPRDGRPLGPMELRLRTAAGMLSTRPGAAVAEPPPGNIDELDGVMAASRTWGLGRTAVHVVDREADLVGHYRRWHAAGHRFVVRGDGDRIGMHEGRERKLAAVAESLGYAPVVDESGRPATVKVRGGLGRLRIAEAAVVLHRPARQRRGEKGPDGRRKQVEVPGPPLPLRLVVARVVDEARGVLAEWFLLTNVPAEQADAATIGGWYAMRWSIETYHKLLKSSGMNAESWGQKCGEAFLRRLCVASMACLTAWLVQRDESPAGRRFRAVLVRLSGRAMKHRVESTAPAVLAGLERLLAIDDLMRTQNLDEILALARRQLPRLFPNRSG